MASPFPGMNPFLEQDDVWHDFHESFVPALRDAIAAQAGPQYILKIDEHVFIHELGQDERHFVGRPDVFAGERQERDVAGSSPTSVVTEPCQVQLVGVDFERLSFLELRDRKSRRLVTVVEVLSPSNKYPGGDREQFLAKRIELLKSDVNYVEIDFLRGGPRLPLDQLPKCDYYVLVSRPAHRPRAGVWPIGLRDSLPEVGIPLREPDDDIKVDLKAVLDRVYDSARYENWIYDTPPSPQLSAEDSRWALEILDQKKPD